MNSMYKRIDKQLNSEESFTGQEVKEQLAVAIREITTAALSLKDSHGSRTAANGVPRTNVGGDRTADDSARLNNVPGDRTFADSMHNSNVPGDRTAADTAYRTIVCGDMTVVAGKDLSEVASDRMPDEYTHENVLDGRIADDGDKHSNPNDDSQRNVAVSEQPKVVATAIDYVPSADNSEDPSENDKSTDYHSDKPDVSSKESIEKQEERTVDSTISGGDGRSSSDYVDAENGDRGV